MIEEFDLGFCNLIFSSEDKHFNHEKQAINKAYNYNKTFFNIKIPKFNIQFVYSRKEFDLLCGDKTPNYVSAFAESKKIIIFSYGVFDKEIKWPKEKFEEVLIHEINHLFYKKIRGDEYHPLWLSEGLATFMQHKKKKWNYKKKIKLTKKKLNQKVEEMNEESYTIFSEFVEYLILTFGEQKLLNFIKKLKNKISINDSFKEVYKKSFEELIQEGNKYQKIM